MTTQILLAFVGCVFVAGVLGIVIALIIRGQS